MPSLLFGIVFFHIILWFVVVESKFPAIVNLNATCLEKGISVRIDFDIPFNGIIYAKESKIFRMDSYCTYVRRDSMLATHEFLIRYETCGTQQTFVNSPEGPSGYETTIVIQNDQNYQDISDSVHEIRCTAPKKSFTKTAEFPHFRVDTLDAVTISPEAEKFESWMNVQRGVFPETIPIEGTVKIGENLTVFFYILNKVNTFDMRVFDCWAFHSPPQYDSFNVDKLQLTDTVGCSLKKNLISHWMKAKYSGLNDTVLLSYAIIKAFRFTNDGNVYLRCKIEVCKNTCLSHCPGEMTETQSIPLQSIIRLVPKDKLFPLTTPHSEESAEYRAPATLPAVP